MTDEGSEIDTTSTFQVAADVGLFERWKTLARRVEWLNTIVQNDTELSLGDVIDWSDRVKEINDALFKLALDTEIHVRNNWRSGGGK